MKILNYLLAAMLTASLLQVKAQCAATGSLYTASYPAGWTVTDGGDGTNDLAKSCSDNYNGTIYLNSTAAYFCTARCSRELRASRAIPTVSNTSWTMDFTLVINPSFYDPTLLKSNNPSVVLAALASDPTSLQSACTNPNLCTSCGSYPNTNFDAMWVALTANPPKACSDNQADAGWRIVALARDGSALQNASTPINISPTHSMYYIRLQRTDAGNAVISVFYNSDFTGHVSGSPQCLSIPGSVTDLDVLTHEVDSKGYCQRVFNGIVDHLKIDNGVTCPFPMTPSFTAPSSVCESSSFTVNGSASTASNNLGIASHLWAVEECDANGNQFGPVWYGPVISGAPSGNYTINPVTVGTAGVEMVCGHYYKVSLILTNCGNPWSASSKVVYIKCPPSIRVDGPLVVCSGDEATLSADISGGSGNYSVTWSQVAPAGGVIYSGSPAPVTVTPTVTTTYLVTAYDNVTGCSSFIQYILTVTQADPSFNLYVNTADPGYFTLSLTPNDLNGYNVSGFQYALAIEELDPSNNPYYADQSTATTCWSAYPANETFSGYVSLTGGTYTQAAGSPCGTDGQFLYNHTYRITRVVSNDYCAAQQSSIIVTATKSGEMVVFEDSKAPDATGMLQRHLQQEKVNAVVISPNPSTGIFTIDMGDEAEGSMVEVVNALGQKVKTIERTAGNRSRLDLTGFTKGLYLVNITYTNGTVISKKIILE